MRKQLKKLVTIGMVACLSVSSSMIAFAGQWQQTGAQWKYQNDDGSYLTGWQWLDGNGDNIAECYYLNNDGIMLANCTTPDNYTVNADGQWVQNGIVQTKILGNDTPTQETQHKTPENNNRNSGVITEEEIAALIPGWNGGDVDVDDISGYPIGGGEHWH